MTTAFVLSGGGSLGAVQVGMLEALTEAGIVPDLLVGSSVGAVNAGYVAEHGTEPASIADLRAIWSGLRRGDVFPLQPVRLAATLVGRAPTLCSNAGLRHLLERHTRTERIEEARIPLHVIATDVRSGEEVVLSSGDPIPAVLASAAIPAVFPPVRVDDRDLIDGSIANDAAVSRAVALGAEIVYVLPTGYTCALDELPATPLSAALHAVTLLIERRLITDVAQLSSRCDIRVLPPLCPLSVSSVDFHHGSELIDRARDATRRWLEQGGEHQVHPEQILSLHRHPPTGSR